MSKPAVRNSPSWSSQNCHLAVVQGAYVVLYNAQGQSTPRVVMHSLVVLAVGTNLTHSDCVLIDVHSSHFRKGRSLEEQWGSNQDIIKPAIATDT